jgi:hypothetical protein
MVSPKIKDGNCRLQLSITKETDQVLRKYATHKGDISKIIEQLIKDKYGAENSEQKTEN